MRTSLPIVVVVMLTVLSPVALLACEAPDQADHEADERTSSSASPLTPTDPVSAAVSDSCTTSAVKGLATQLVEEMQCMRPGTCEKLEGSAGITLASAAFPFVQTPVAKALRAAQKSRGVPLVVNSALRTLPQQYLLYRWYKTGRCGIQLAASPGTSNHESGLAVDIDDNAEWRSAMAANDLKWFGSNDPVHFDYVGSGSVELSGLSVLAFQRLWNRNHPEDRITEDSTYGGETETRLAEAPVGGFAKGAECVSNGVDAGVLPDDAGNRDGASQSPWQRAPDDRGCAIASSQTSRAGADWPCALVLGALFLASSRRRNRLRTESSTRRARR